MSTQFAYTAVPLKASGGSMVRGVREASDERELRDALRDQGLLAVRVRPVHLLDALRASVGGRRVSGQDRLWFFETLAYMVGSNVPIETAMQEMAGGAPGDRLSRVCLDVRERLRAGDALSEAIVRVSADRAGKGLADEHHIAIIRSGERSGRLGHACDLVQRSITDAQRVRGVVVGRLIYPTILVVATVVVLWVLATFVVPKFETTLTALGGELPWQTVLTLRASETLLWLLPVLGVVTAVLVAMRRRLLDEERAGALSRRLLRLPVVGSLIWHHQSGLVCDVLASMVEGGGDVLEALDQSVDVARSREIRRRLERARSRVREGEDLAEALRGGEGGGVLPPMVGAVVGVGVRTGELAESLRRASALCVQRQERITQTLLTLMEPGIILLLSASVGWVVYSLVVGMLAMTDIASG